MRNNKLIIAIDCGFDAVKIDINQKLYSFPSFIIPLDDSIQMSRKTEDYIEYNEKNQNEGIKKYLVGNFAQQELYSPNKKKSNIELINKLKTLDGFFTDIEGKKIGFCMYRAAICYALIKYAEEKDNDFVLENINDYEIYVSVAIPDSMTDKIVPDLRGALGQKKTIDITVGDTTHLIELNIPFDNIGCVSQVIASFYNLGYDENGKAKNFDALEELLPAIIIDGGYRTVGLAQIRKDYSLTVERSESNTELAMIEVDKAVAAKVNEIARKEELTDNFEPLEYYEVQSIIDDANSFFRYEVVADNTVGFEQHEISAKKIKDIYDKTAEEYATDFVKYLAKDYKLSNANTIIIAGGTGIVYRNKIAEVIKEVNKNVKVILQGEKYADQDAHAVYSIVIGLHKIMLSLYCSE